MICVCRLLYIHHTLVEEIANHSSSQALCSIRAIPVSISYRLHTFYRCRLLQKVCIFGSRVDNTYIQLISRNSQYQRYLHLLHHFETMTLRLKRKSIYFIKWITFGIYNLRLANCIRVSKTCILSIFMI